MTPTNRRAWFATVPLAALALAGCGTSATDASASTVAARIIATGQAGLTALRAVFAVEGARLAPGDQSKVSTALDAAQAAASTVGAAVAGGALAVANATTASNLAPELRVAAELFIAGASLVPGLGNAIAVARDVVALEPAIVALVNSVRNPTAVGASFDGGAAGRLGVII